jgi:hypothetical protein
MCKYCYLNTIFASIDRKKLPLLSSFEAQLRKRNKKSRLKTTKTFPPDEIIIIKQNKMKPVQFELQDQT